MSLTKTIKVILTCVCSSSMLEELGVKALGERDSMALGPATIRHYHVSMSQQTQLFH